MRRVARAARRRAAARRLRHRPGRGARGRRGHARHARLRPRGDRAPPRTKTLREDETVMRLTAVEVRRGDPLRRPLRRRRSTGVKGDGAGGDARLVLLRQRSGGRGRRRRVRAVAGDRVQWDFRDWGAAMRVPAIVGAFPEPFLQRAQGRGAGRCGSSATTRSPTPAAPPRTRSTRGACRCPGRRWARRGPRTSRGWWWPAGRRARIVRGGLTWRRGPSAAACSRASRRTAARSTCSTRDGDVARTVHAGDGTALVAALRPRADELRLARDLARRSRAWRPACEPCARTRCATRSRWP